MLTYLKHQLYYFNIPAFLLICLFVIILGKLNMKKEVKKIHKTMQKEVDHIRLQLKVILDRIDKK